MEITRREFINMTGLATGVFILSSVPHYYFTDFTYGLPVTGFVNIVLDDDVLIANNYSVATPTPVFTSTATLTPTRTRTPTIVPTSMPTWIPTCTPTRTPKRTPKPTKTPRP